MQDAQINSRADTIKIPEGVLMLVVLDVPITSCSNYELLLKMKNKLNFGLGSQSRVGNSRNKISSSVSDCLP